MISGIIHKGSGLGNQLFRYIFVRTLALDRGWDFGFEGIENFKAPWMKLDWGKPVEGIQQDFIEARVNNAQGVDIRSYDDRIKNITDNTRIDGEFQGEWYFQHRKEEIKEWLGVHDNPLPDEVCIINFRGGEYKGVKDLYLTQEYWNKAMKEMGERVGYKRFMVVTDDVEEAQKFFPFFPVNHDMEMDWRMINSAKYLILSNSSFAILPALLGKAEIIIAPKYWARRNTGVWAMSYNKYENWVYI